MKNAGEWITISNGYRKSIIDICVIQGGDSSCLVLIHKTRLSSKVTTGGQIVWLLFHHLLRDLPWKRTQHQWAVPEH